MTTIVSSNCGCFVGDVYPNWSYNGQNFPQPPLSAAPAVVATTCLLPLMGVGAIWWFMFLGILTDIPRNYYGLSSL